MENKFKHLPRSRTNWQRNEIEAEKWNNNKKIVSISLHKCSMYAVRQQYQYQYQIGSCTFDFNFIETTNLNFEAHDIVQKCSIERPI